MVRRRAAAADIATAIGYHSFRATGITTYLKNVGTLERAATMATTPQRGRPSSTIADRAT
jgi:integrase/recombinase XerC